MRILSYWSAGCFLVSVLLLTAGCNAAASPKDETADEAASGEETSDVEMVEDVVDQSEVQNRRLQALVRWEPTQRGDGVSTFLERTDPVYGDLCLHISAAAGSMMLSENRPPRMIESELPAAELALSLLLKIEEPKEQYETLIQLQATFPFWPKLHGALCDNAIARGDLDAAVFHSKQQIYTKPNFYNVSGLGRLYGRQGKYEESMVVLLHLFENREQATKEEAITMIGDLLVCLHRADKHEEMVRIADQGLADYGPVSRFEYQAILGLHLRGKNHLARERLSRVLEEIDPADPLLLQFELLKDAVGWKDEDSGG